MLKKIKAYWEKRKQTKTQKQQLIKMQAYYQVLKSGALFLKFIREDMTKMKKEQCNRSQRRRFEQQLSNKGEFNEEIVKHYEAKIVEILEYIDKQLNPQKAGTVRVEGKKI